MDGGGDDGGGVRRPHAGWLLSSREPFLFPAAFTEPCVMHGKSADSSPPFFFFFFFFFWLLCWCGDSAHSAEVREVETMEPLHPKRHGAIGGIPNFKKDWKPINVSANAADQVIDYGTRASHSVRIHSAPLHIFRTFPHVSTNPSIIKLREGS